MAGIESIARTFQMAEAAVLRRQVGSKGRAAQSENAPYKYCNVSVNFIGESRPSSPSLSWPGFLNQLAALLLEFPPRFEEPLVPYHSARAADWQAAVGGQVRIV